MALYFQQIFAIDAAVGMIREALTAADVADRANGLPQDLRARIFYLAEFTDQHSSKVLSGKGKADVLVEINAAIMRGLREGAGR